MMETASGARIREARLEDAAALAGLATQLGYPSTPEELAARLKRILGQPDQCVLVAETDGNEPRGFAHIAAGMALQSGEKAELVGLVMEESLRGRGIGRKLVAASERWAASHGFGTMVVRCNLVRTDTHRFYEQLGYECSKTQKHFRKSLKAES